MKTLSSIKHILLAVTVFGFFANLAQNEYGFDIVLFCLFGFIIIFFSEAIFNRIKEELVPESLKNLNNKLIRILYILILCFITITFFFKILTVTYNIEIIKLIVTISFYTIIFLSILLVIYLYPKRPLFLESLFLMLLSIGFTAKYFQLFGIAIVLLFAFLFLITHFTLYSFHQYERIKHENKILAFFIFIFIFIISLSGLNIFLLFFEVQGSLIVSIILLTVTLFFYFLIIFQIKFNYNNQKILLWTKLKQIKGNCFFVFIFCSLFLLYSIASKFEIIPKIYSLRFTPAEKKLKDDVLIEKYYIYITAKEKFIKNREIFEKNEKK